MASTGIRGLATAASYLAQQAVLRRKTPLFRWADSDGLVLQRLGLVDGLADPDGVGDPADRVRDLGLVSEAKGVGDGKATARHRRLIAHPARVGGGERAT